MSPSSASTVCVLLAAGAGKRFQGPVHKLLTTIPTSRGPEPVVVAAARAMVDSGAGRCLVIAGAVDLRPTLASIDGLHIVDNADWQSGMRSSVLLALHTARTWGCTQVVIGLGDQPFVESATWSALAAVDSPVAIATYSGRRGNPVKLGASTWDEFTAEEGDPDAGARSLVSRHPEWVAEVPSSGSDRDIDTLEDLPPWKH